MMIGTHEEWLANRVGQSPYQSQGSAATRSAQALADYYSHPAVMLLSTAGGALATYHGYVRTQSIGWTLLWGLAGSIAPLITLPIALAQGFGKRA